VSARGRVGLMARIREIRRLNESSASGTRSTAERPDDHELRLLGERVTQLEQLVQGLQDAVHRESRRQGERIAELEGRVQPAAIAKALSEDARKRGL
jgi:hypothetical protein